MPDLAVLLSACLLLPQPLLRKSLSRNCPSSPARKVEAMMQYLPGGTKSLRLTWGAVGDRH